MNSIPTNTEMQRAFSRRDPSYDGIFFTGVKTTGIFCRPSCSARKPRPENLEFFPTIKKAMFSGYRPCKRCDPLNVSGTPPAWVARLLAKIEEDPSARIKDGDLRSEGIDPARARRYFLKQYGVTFHAYGRGRRLGKAFQAVRRGADLDDVVFDTGYESHSGFREAFAKTFGRPPGKSRTDDCIVLTWMESPLGPLVAGATDKGVCLLEFSDRRMLEAQFHTLRQRLGKALVPGKHPHLTRLKEELVEYFAGKRTEFSLPLDYPGTPFQQKTWDGLRKIPYAETWSYEDLARHVGKPKAQRAVGHANGLNRIAIVIPCHRVVNKSGELGGYGGGVWRKRFLLDLEQAAITPSVAKRVAKTAR
ncbi:MAG: methylated-DNA--[protein]-cysteine S-methyltransferase [Pseudomonadota bacterium]